jgi:hypothetical protein
MYHLYLARVKRAFAGLPPPGTMVRDERILKVAQDCRLPPEWLSDHVRDGEGRRRRGVSVKRLARILTASEFRITDQRVQNILSEKPSRK